MESFFKKLFILLLIVSIFGACRKQPIQQDTHILKAEKQISMLGDSTFFNGLIEMVSFKKAIYMADNSPRVFRLDSNLNPVQQIYNIGKGPGEFTGISDISYANDSLYIYTRSQAKIMVYDSLGNFIREFDVGNISGGNIIVVNNSVFLSTPFANKTIVKLDMKGNNIKSFGIQTASKKSFNAYRNERILLINDQKLIAISPSEPLIRVYNLNGELINETRINHPLLENRIDYINEASKKTPRQGGYRLILLFYDAVIFDNNLYLLAITNTEETDENMYSFVLKYEIEEDGRISYTKDFKLFKPDSDDKLSGIDLGFIAKGHLIVYDLRSKIIYSFKDERI